MPFPAKNTTAIRPSNPRRHRLALLFALCFGAKNSVPSPNFTRFALARRGDERAEEESDNARVGKGNDVFTVNTMAGESQGVELAPRSTVADLLYELRKGNAEELEEEQAVALPESFKKLPYGATQIFVAGREEPLHPSVILELPTHETLFALKGEEENSRRRARLLQAGAMCNAYNRADFEM